MIIPHAHLISGEKRCQVQSEYKLPSHVGNTSLPNAFLVHFLQVSQSIFQITVLISVCEKMFASVFVCVSYAFPLVLFSSALFVYLFCAILFCLFLFYLILFHFRYFILNLILRLYINEREKERVIILVGVK